MKSVTFAVHIVFLVALWNPLLAMSPVRNPNEPWLQAKASAELAVGAMRLHGVQNQLETPYELAIPFKDFQQDSVQIPDTEANPLVNLFSHLRDFRGLDDPAESNFPRRLSWLYPDDGCFARAMVLWDWARRSGTGAVEMVRVYVFGNLTVKTPNHPNGEVSWWYHTAMAAKSEGALWVLDPAIEARSPLLFDDWLGRQSDDTDNLMVAACHPASYSPGDHCLSPDANRNFQLGRAHMQSYLRSERERMVELGLEPDAVLGNSPPWGALSGGERPAIH